MSIVVIMWQVSLDRLRGNGPTVKKLKILKRQYKFAENKAIKEQVSLDRLPSEWTNCQKSFKKSRNEQGNERRAKNKKIVHKFS